MTGGCETPSTSTITGVRYDAVEKTLYVEPPVEGDFRCLLCTATGYGTAGLKYGEPFVEVKQGRIDVDRIEHEKRRSGP
jgi:hypothetical protein